MTRKQNEELAYQMVSTSKWNCAEGVLVAALQQFKMHHGSVIPRIATCFGGGVGITGQEMCGALAGGLMAIGIKFGRDKPGMPCEEAYDLAAQFRESFTDLYGVSRCEDLRICFGKQENWEKCKRLCGQTVGILYTLLHEKSVA